MIAQMRSGNPRCTRVFGSGLRLGPDTMYPTSANRIHREYSCLVRLVKASNQQCQLSRKSDASKETKLHAQRPTPLRLSAMAAVVAEHSRRLLPVGSGEPLEGATSSRVSKCGAGAYRWARQTAVRLGRRKSPAMLRSLRHPATRRYFRIRCASVSAD